MSGTLVTTTRVPLIVPAESHQQDADDDETANSSDWPCIWDAAVTLMRAIIEPTERSIPPEMTTMA